MINANYNRSACGCHDCGGPVIYGRAAERSAWVKDWNQHLAQHPPESPWDPDNSR